MTVGEAMEELSKYPKDSKFVTFDGFRFRDVRHVIPGGNALTEEQCRTEGIVTGLEPVTVAKGLIVRVEEVK